ncbi:hypothetical protein [Providencia phage PSTCR6]|nr:hypothetical protein [Providencia phage PSTCR6]
MKLNNEIFTKYFEDRGIEVIKVDSPIFTTKNHGEQAAVSRQILDSKVQESLEWVILKEFKTIYLYGIDEFPHSYTLRAYFEE